MTGSRRRDADDRRAEILAAASGLFARRGYDATSMQEIADAVGLLKGSLYHHFASKEDILFHLLVDVHERALRMLDEVADVEGTPLDRIAGYVRAHFTWTLRDLERVAILLAEYHHLPPEQARPVAQLRRRFSGYLTGLIEEAQRAGQVAGDLDARIAANAVLGIVNWASQWYRPGGARSQAAVVDQLVRQALVGVAEPGAWPPGS
ncbi:MAG: TetR/AcrR family transcriptional regulator [Acidimicrobiia bacterium]|nr:TetR/AcrR family transcriptional regulator [Acidimicrobiia bacterium]